MGCRSATLRRRCRARGSLTGTFNPTLREKPGRAGEGCNPRAVGHSHYEGKVDSEATGKQLGSADSLSECSRLQLPPWNHEKAATSIIPSSVVLRNYLAHHGKG